MFLEKIFSRKSIDSINEVNTIGDNNIYFCDVFDNKFKCNIDEAYEKICNGFFINNIIKNTNSEIIIIISWFNGIIRKQGHIMFGKHISSTIFVEHNIYYNPETLYIIIKETTTEQTFIDLLIINSDLYLCAESFIKNYDNQLQIISEPILIPYINTQSSILMKYIIHEIIVYNSTVRIFIGINEERKKVCVSLYTDELLQQNGLIKKFNFDISCSYFLGGSRIDDDMLQNLVSCNLPRYKECINLNMLMKLKYLMLNTINYKGYLIIHDASSINNLKLLYIRLIQGQRSIYEKYGSYPNLYSYIYNSNTIIQYIFRPNINLNKLNEEYRKRIINGLPETKKLKLLNNISQKISIPYDITDVDSIIHICVYYLRNYLNENYGHNTYKQHINLKNESTVSYWLTFFSSDLSDEIKIILDILYAMHRNMIVYNIESLNIQY
jgi:hypothetical protein